MTVTAHPRPSAVAQAVAIAGRSVRGVLRQPPQWVPSLVFPLFFNAVSAAAFDRTRALPGFPEVNSFLTFLLPATILQGVLLGATAAGNDAAVDIENGFFDRLVLSPMSRVSLLGGRLVGSMALGVVQVVFFLSVLSVFGARLENPLAGVLVLVVVGALLAGAVGAFSVSIALRTGSVEAVNGFFPIFFAALFMSSAFFPPSLSGGWFETVASINPITWIVDGLRDVIIEGWVPGAAARAIAVSAALGVLAIFMATRSLAARIRT